MDQSNEIYQVAKSQIGYREGESDGHWNNIEKYAGEVPGLSWANGQPWCAVFVSWVADKAMCSDLYPRTASCLTAVQWFKQRGRFSEYPSLGAQAFYGPGGGSHTGLVYAYDADNIHAIEGNTNANGSPEGNGVYDKTRARRSTEVYGYGLPQFTAPVVTADPALKGKRGYTYAAAATAATPAPVAAKPVTTAKTVIVRAGMTLAGIATAAGITLASLLGSNPGIKNPNLIQPGQTITVPAVPPKATAKPSPKTNPPKTAPPFPGAGYFGPGKDNAYVTELGQALVRHGYGRFYKVGPGPKWGPADQTATAAFQRAQGWSGAGANGIPGPLTWSRLMK